MLGPATVTVNAELALATPLTVTTTLPVVAAVGTTARDRRVAPTGNRGSRCPVEGNRTRSPASNRS